MPKPALTLFADSKMRTLWLWTLLIIAAPVNAAHWRERQYDIERMARYKPFRYCIAFSAEKNSVPEELLYSMLWDEQGAVNGNCSVNRNKTKDCGPIQINDVRKDEVALIGYSMQDVRHKPCKSIYASAFLVASEIYKAKDFWLGVGNYHYQHSVGPKTHASYVRKIKKAWDGLVAREREFR